MRKTWFRSIYKFLTVFDFAIFFVDTIFAIQFYKGEQKVNKNLCRGGVSG